MRYIFSFLFALCALLYACKLNPDVQSPGELFLQGVWEQDSVQYQDQLLIYTIHKFTFTCDSFYVRITTKARANEYPDSCFNNGSWDEYAKGVYILNKDTLYLNGTFTRSNFKQKISGCYRIGQYLPVFIIKDRKSAKLLFQSDHTFVALTLKKKIICKSKSR